VFRWFRLLQWVIVLLAAVSMRLNNLIKLANHIHANPASNQHLHCRTRDSKLHDRCPTKRKLNRIFKQNSPEIGKYVAFF
jgi:hypothetical protein